MADSGDLQTRLQDLPTELTLASGDHWHALFDVVRDPIFIHDAQFRVVGANQAYVKQAGIPYQEIIGQPYWRCFPIGDGPLPSCSRALTERQDGSDDDFILPDGRIFRSRGFAVYDHSHAHRVSVHILEDISLQVAMEESLRRSEEQFRLVTGAIDDVFWLSTPDLNRFDYVSPAFDHMWGFPRSTLTTYPDAFVDAVHVDDRPYCTRPFPAGRSEPDEAEYRLLRPDGTAAWIQDRRFPIVDAAGKVILIAGVASDITERKNQEEQLRYQGTHDLLTRLPNRALISDRLELAIAQAHRHNRLIGVLFLDLDRFKLINDSLGHSVGDVVLCEVAARLRGCSREGDTVGRLGGDEFVVILPDLGDQDEAITIAQRLLHEVARAIPHPDHELNTTTSIGISIYPRDGTDVGTLLRNADTAMYRAKDMGRDNLQFFTAELNARVLERLTLEGALRRALDRGEFELYYQPQVDLTTGYITGMEALLRWHHPDLGLVAPGQFISIAEETNLIVPIGAWVLRTACEQMRQWQDAGLPAITMAVNVSVQQFRSGRFIDTVRQCVSQCGVEPKLLELELTESMLAEEPDKLRTELHELKALGAQLALDDFGTGYSSLNYLRHYPFDTLKIDQSFVRDITTNPESATISRTIIAMAHALGLQVTAEGIEHQAQAHYLRRALCDQMQGYYFGRPMPAADATALLRKGEIGGESEAGGDRGELHTLLIVDDDLHVIAALERLLRHEGYRILSATTAEKGFEQLAIHGAAVVISDQRMPGMTGTEFLSRIKDIHPNTVRILLTGYADMATAKEAVNAGAVFKFMSKPWDNDELAEVVQEAFRRHVVRAAHTAGMT
ncbi:MAG: hypothetical protein CVV05_05005 [Gammaproteobacteria bacterium HGW-Gammaproteobacteria-1]|jgi:diguanylate cyclase (GGDEF)-like protein/PAS domain S-box-containing protein|nr:MAG: hypothetical protein CVV05_05005 [Gammaproteobacteria bacterium HGW-Gammaproteobacteria-1]